MVRAGFRAGERLAPELTARTALRLWCLVPRRRGGGRPVRAVGVVPAGPDVVPPGSLSAVAVQGRRVTVESWGEGPVVLLVHGWGGWRHQLGPFVAPLVAAGCRVVAFDGLSHGDSDPGALGRRRSTLPELSAAVREVAEAVGPVEGIVAHSLGGAAAGLAVLDGLVVRRLVTIGTPANPFDYVDEFAWALGFGQAVRDRLLRLVEGLTGRSAAEFDLAVRARAAAASARALPDLLVVHDLADKEVRHRDAQAIAAAWPTSELLTTSGLGHRRILGDGPVIEAVTAHLAPAAHP